VNTNATPREINDCIIGIEELSNNDFTVFPVPARNTLTIQSNEEVGKIELFDFTGRLLLTEQSFGTRLELSIDFLNAGIYAVRRNNEKILLIEKL
jgi:hypothetical protein